MCCHVLVGSTPDEHGAFPRLQDPGNCKVTSHSGDLIETLPGRLVVTSPPAVFLPEVPGEGERWEDEGNARAGQGADQRIQRPIVGRQQREEPDQQSCKHVQILGSRHST